MRDPLSLTAEKVQKVVQQKGSITLSDLEAEVDASYNLIFLAIDRMVSRSQLQMKKWGRDYLISGNPGSRSLPVHDSMDLLVHGHIHNDVPGLQCEVHCIAQDME